MDKSGIIRCDVEGYEKRPATKEVGKHYVYRIRVEYSSGKVDRVWRRYSQFDALRQTLSGFLKKDGADAIDAPKLTPKRFLGRSSVRNVAETRAPRLQAYLDEIISGHSDNAALMTALAFFLTPTATDVATKASAKEPDSDDEDGDVTIGTLTQDVPGSHDGELAASKGEVVLLSKKSLEQAFKRPDGDWAMARTPDGARGLVPLAMVEINTHNSDDEGDAPKVKSAAAELVQTEKQFLANLVEVRDKFFPKLRHILTAPEAKCLFGNWAELIKCSEELKVELENARENVAPVLVSGLPKLREPYSKYCQGIPAAQELYNQKQVDKKFIAFEQSFPEMNKPTLNHFMRPVQRIMKYPLLLMEMKKQAAKADAADSTAQSNLDTITAALEIATELANDANANMNKPVETFSKQDISGPQHDTFSHVKHVEGSRESPAANRRMTAPADHRKVGSPGGSFLTKMGRSNTKRMAKKPPPTVQQPGNMEVKPEEILASPVLRAMSSEGTSDTFFEPGEAEHLPEDYLSVSPCTYESAEGRPCNRIAVPNCTLCANHLCPTCNGPKRSVHETCRACERDSGAAIRMSLSAQRAADTGPPASPESALSSESPTHLSKPKPPPPTAKPPTLPHDGEQSKPTPPPPGRKPPLSVESKPPPPPNKPQGAQPKPPPPAKSPPTLSEAKPRPPPNKPKKALSTEPKPPPPPKPVDSPAGKPTPPTKPVLSPSEKPPPPPKPNIDPSKLGLKPS